MKDAIFIEGRRNGYSPNQCGKTMTIGEIIELMQEYADDYGKDTPVFLINDGGYTFGNITKGSVYSEEYDEEE